MEVSSTFILLVQAPTLTSQIYLPRVLTLIFCDHSSLLELIYCSPPVISLELLHFCVFSLDPPCLIRFYLNFSPERPLVLHSPSSLHADIRPPFYQRDLDIVLQVSDTEFFVLLLLQVTMLFH